MTNISCTLTRCHMGASTALVASEPSSEPSTLMVPFSQMRKTEGQVTGPGTTFINGGVGRQPPGVRLLSPQSVRPTTFTVPREVLAGQACPKISSPPYFAVAPPGHSVSAAHLCHYSSRCVNSAQSGLNEGHASSHSWDADTAGKWLPFQVMPLAGSLAVKPRQEQRLQTLDSVKCQSPLCQTSSQSPFQ